MVSLILNGKRNIFNSLSYATVRLCVNIWAAFELCRAGSQANEACGVKGLVVTEKTFGVDQLKTLEDNSNEFILMLFYLIVVVLVIMTLLEASVRVHVMNKTYCKSIVSYNAMMGHCVFILMDVVITLAVLVASLAVLYIAVDGYDDDVNKPTTCSVVTCKDTQCNTVELSEKNFTSSDKDDRSIALLTALVFPTLVLLVGVHDMFKRVKTDLTFTEVEHMDLPSMGAELNCQFPFLHLMSRRCIVEKADGLHTLMYKGHTELEPAAELNGSMRSPL